MQVVTEILEEQTIEKWYSDNCFQSQNKLNEHWVEIGVRQCQQYLHWLNNSWEAWVLQIIRSILKTNNGQEHWMESVETFPREYLHNFTDERTLNADVMTFNPGQHVFLGLILLLCTVPYIFLRVNHSANYRLPHWKAYFNFMVFFLSPRRLK